MSNTRKWIVQGHIYADKARDFIGKGSRVESSRVGEPRRTAPLLGWSLRFYGDGISFWGVFSQSLWLRVLPGGACLVQPRWMPVRRILGGGWTCSLSFWPFPNPSGWWWLITSVFLARTSCRKTTHANSYHGDLPGWAVSVSVLPITNLLCPKCPHDWDAHKLIFENFCSWVWCGRQPYCSVYTFTSHAFIIDLSWCPGAQPKLKHAPSHKTA